MEMEKDAIELLLETGRKSAKAQLLDERCDIKVWLMPDGEIKQIEKDLVRRHTFNSFEGFTSFLNSTLLMDGLATEEGGKGAVFVQGESVFATFEYWSPEQQSAKLALAPSEEYRALERLMHGVDQKMLWRLLVTDLHGCMDTSLLLAVSRLNVKAKAESDVQIAPVGIDSTSGGNTIAVTYGAGKDGSVTANIETEWTWKGRLWDQFPYESEITLRLELDMSDGLVFRFHPRRLGDVKRDVQQALVKALFDDLNSDRWVVNEGVFGG